MCVRLFESRALAADRDRGAGFTGGTQDSSGDDETVVHAFVATLGRKVQTLLAREGHGKVGDD